MITRNDLCWCGSGQKWKKCHYPRVPEESLPTRYLNEYGIIIKTPSQIEGIREACKVTAKILDAVCQAAVAGVSTSELDSLAQKLHKQANAVAAPLGYGHPPYPKSICTSLNEVICHGIPDSRPLQEGDILNIDVSSVVNHRYFGDCSRMVAVGEISKEKELVMNVSLKCLELAIQVCKPGAPIRLIGKAIESYAKSKKCSVVNQFVGHGVGVAFHEPPDIPHYINDSDILMVPGMIFTIEPMINAGVRDAVIDPIDQWTARTKDGKPSAQWEHTILITPTGHEVLTQI